MKKLFLVLGLVLSVWKLVHAQPVNIPGSQFPQVSVPSNSMRFFMVYPPGGLSANPLLASNATISYANLVTALRIAIGGGGGGGSASNAVTWVMSNGVPVVKNATNINFTNYFIAPSSNNNTATIDLGASSTVSLVNLASNVLANLSGGFQFLITSNMTTAQIQSVFNSMTNNGVVSVQPAKYTLTSTVLITNGCVIDGNYAEFSLAAGVTNQMLSTGTNFHGKTLAIQHLKFNGLSFAAYSQSNYFHVENRGAGFQDANPYFNPNYTNRTGLYAEVSGGVIIYDCYFYGWAGNGAVFLSIQSGGQYQYPKLLFLNNHVYTNFQGVLLANITEDTLAYYNNSTAGQGQWTCEYALVGLNDFFQNQIGLNCAPGNIKAQDNQINANWIGMLMTSQNGNEGHGAYQNNTFNHNNFALWSFRNPGGLFEGNTFLRNGQQLQPPNNTNIYYPNGNISGIHFDNVNRIQFVENQLSREYLTFTNACQGVFAHNTYGSLSIGSIQNGILGDSNLVWGVDVPTNFAGSPNMKIYDNNEVLGVNQDGSMGSILEVSTNLPVPNSYPVTRDGTNASWTTNLNGTFSGNGSGITNLNVLNITNAPSATNYLAIINTPNLTAGMAIVFTGTTNADGAAVFKGTNFPTGGGSAFPLAADGDANQFGITNLTYLYWLTNASGTKLSFQIAPDFTQSLPTLKLTPAGQATYAGFKANYLYIEGNGFGGAFQAVVIVTNSGVATIITSNNITTGSGTFSGGSVSVIPTNAAPITLVTNAPGTSLPMGITNVFVGRAQPVIRYFIVDAVTGVPIITFSNEQTSVRLPISYGALALTETNVFVLPVTTTNSVWRVRDESTGSGASVGVLTNWLIGQ